MNMKYYSMFILLTILSIIFKCANSNEILKIFKIILI